MPADLLVLIHEDLDVAWDAAIEAGSSMIMYVRLSQAYRLIPPTWVALPGSARPRSVWLGCWWSTSRGFSDTRSGMWGGASAGSHTSSCSVASGSLRAW